MKYKVLIERYAQKQIMKLDRKIIPVIKASIIDLADNPRPYGYKKLWLLQPADPSLQNDFSAKMHPGIFFLVAPSDFL